MEWLTVISFILVGIMLVVVEIILVPGTTLVGVVGVILAIAGIVLGFRYFGSTTGYWLMTGAALAGAGAFYWSFRTRSWDRFSLKDSIDSKVNEGSLKDLSPGAEGIALSSLRPSGNAEFAGKVYEVTTLGNFLDTGTPVKIIRIEDHRVIVEPVNQI